jgi:competence protein ComEC
MEWMKIRLKADLTLLLAAIIWGTAFAVQRVAAQVGSIFMFNGLRFMLGILVLLPWALSLRALARGQWTLGLLLSAAVGVLLALGPGPRADGRLEIAFLDVGQGDAIVLRSPSGRFLAVDAGLEREGFDLGERIVAPFLWSQGARGLDGFLLTHAHPDHAGGAPFLLRAFDPAVVWEGKAPGADGGYRIFDAAAEQADARRLSVTRGLSWAWDGVTLEVLGPDRSGARPRRTRNDDSVVLLARFGDVCALLTGDIEQAAERALAFPPCVILKVPHHGSKTSTSPELLRSARPRIAVVSAGQRNRFGHPHPDVLDRLQMSGLRVLRTDQEGTIRLLTDGRRIWLRQGRGGVERRAL